MRKKFLFIGGRGYLGQALIKKLQKENDIVVYPNDIRVRISSTEKFDTVFHFAGPSDDYDFADKKKTITTIVDGTINVVNYCLVNNIKLIFSSSMAVHHIKLNDNYSTGKLAMENYIRSILKDFLILRIPRVYSKCRKKGLMKKIRNNQVPVNDLNNVIEYITLDDFVTQTLQMLDSERNTTCEYQVNNKKTIREIAKEFS